MAEEVSQEVDSISMNGCEKSAVYESFLLDKFPTIDSDLLIYVKDVLQHGEDFENGNDIYDAVGGILHEVTSNNADDDEIKAICDQLMGIMKRSSSTEKFEHKKLDAPVILENTSLCADNEEEEAVSIWIKKQNDSTTVDQRKLGKAEAKLKAKQEKREEKEEKKPNVIVELDGATASQSGNRREAKMEASGTNKSRDIRIENFDLAFGERLLLKNANVSFAAGRRYGLIGRNGVGKTTFLRTLSRRELFVPSHISILHVEQEVIGDETPALESVLECDKGRYDLLKEERELVSQAASGSPECKSNGGATGRLSQIYVRLEEIEADKAPARASTILAGLGFSPQMQRQYTKEFSGGWRMRIALARALFSKPDLLLLDEPTNMLDLKAVMWLENYLQTWVTTILVVSHDRNFLDSVCTDILHMHSQKLDYYKGNYENFHKTREEKLLNQQREYESQQMYRQHLQAFIDKFRYNAKRASLAQSKIKILEKLPVLQPVAKEAPVMIQFPECEKLSPPVLQLDEVTFYYDASKVIFEKVDISCNSESRIAVVGDNGSGKTTLLKILLGELEPVKGIKHCHRNLKVGYFSQHHVDQLQMGQSALGMLAEKFPGKTMEQYRHQLGRYGVSGDLATRPLLSLSGGQKSRVIFSLMTNACPNLLILDEPTNHLDMETIEALAKALKNFKGGVILVSHDERLVRSMCKEVWVCGKGKVQSIEGGFEEYKRIVQEELKLLE
ncbi:ATP-binding cassette sub-family F member 3-like [Actinia tenebrosa]|uniref:ATP-binding cassette sub-family F member 3 n=1 Tax=Actinia tenebrosa TaxID=6105 RepID=A0A6P8JCM0_ACTTE|nr:ATP-binding cassette sub-family F member 3-like [Actinia tenebrosa]